MRSLAHSGVVPCASRALATSAAAHSYSDKPAFVVINQQITDCKRRSDWAGVLAKWENDSGQFNHINYATSVSALQNVCRRLRDSREQQAIRRDPRLHGLLGDITSRLEHSPQWFGVQAMANIVHGAAQLGVLKTMPRLCAAIDKDAERIVEQGTPQNIANTAWAFAKSGYRPDALLAAIEKEAGWLVNHPDAKPQHIANTAWAVAKLGRNSEPLLAAIEKETRWLVNHPDASPQAIAHTVWAFAKLGRNSEPLLAAIEKETRWLVNHPDAKPQHIANTAWAFATLGRQSEPLLAAIAKEIEWFVNDASPQAICTVLWSLWHLDKRGTHETATLALWNHIMHWPDAPSCLPFECKTQLRDIWWEGQGVHKGVHLTTPPPAMQEMLDEE